MKKIKNHVRYVLMTDNKSRDNDRYLCWRIWSDILKRDFESMTISYEEYTKLPTEWTINRHRRQLQQFNPELRGLRYKERKTYWTDKVKDDVKDGKWEEIQAINEKRKRKKNLLSKILGR